MIPDSNNKETCTKEGAVSHFACDNTRKWWRRDWFFAVLIFVVIALAYRPAWNGKPVWDDDGHITKPELRSLGGLARIWLQPGATQQYYPVTHTLFWVEQKLWSDAPAGYHLANILLHSISALLLLKILRRLEVPGAWFAAALWALHPVQVESVAWITELKNTLSGACCLGSALAFLRFDRERDRTFYMVSFLLFLAGLLSKSVTATLPVVLLVVFWWQRGALSWKRDALPLMPFFAAGAGMGLFTAWMEKTYIGAQGAEFNFSFPERCLIAGHDLWFYLGKLAWPHPLIFIYPRWNIDGAVWWQYLYPAAALFLAALLWSLRRQTGRAPLAALLFFAATLFPALGFFNVYPFRFSFVADHFQYLASIGPLTLAAAGITAALARATKQRSLLQPLICGGLLAVLAALTFEQSAMYSDIETLWRVTLRRNPDCWLAWNNLGDVFIHSGRADQAIADYQKALALNPDYADAHNNLGNILRQQGRVDEAITHYVKALDIYPGYADAHNNLGTALLQKGRVDEAIAHFQKALAGKPDLPEIHYNLGNALLQKGRFDGAIAHYEKVLEIRPDDAVCHNNLATALIQEGRVDEAIVHFRRALEIKPDYEKARTNLDAVLRQTGHAGEPTAR